MMIRIVLTIELCLLLCPFHRLIAQIDPGDYVAIPQSPEAAAFAEYGRQDVALFTGKAGVSVPIGSVQGKSLSIPVALTYSGGGVKVEQIATEVGLGWNLQVGGMVTKEVKGLPDHYITGSHQTIYSPDPVLWRESTSDALGDFSFKAYFDLFKALELQSGDRLPASEQIFGEYIHYQQRVIKREIDSQVDLYSIQVPGVSSSVYIDYDTDTGNEWIKRAISMDDPTLDVKVHLASNGTTRSTTITGWIVKDRQGNTYEFDHAEYTESFDDSGNFLDQLKHNSAWYITKITSGDNRDTYDFLYDPVAPWTAQQPALKRAIYTDWHNDAPADPECKQAETYTVNSQVNYTIGQPFLRQVRRNTRPVIQINREIHDRKDLAGRKAIKEVIIKDLTSQNVIQRCQLVHSYAGDENSLYDWDSRLMLDAVKLMGNSDTASMDYTFQYIRRDQIPSRTSNAQDFWGFFNGFGGDNLFPRNSDYDDLNMTGVNRSARLDYATVGMLSKISYPTGGFTEFSYQLPFIPGDQLIENRKTWGKVVVVGGEEAGTYCDDAVLAIPNSATDYFKLSDSTTVTVEISIS